MKERKFLEEHWVEAIESSLKKDYEQVKSLIDYMSTRFADIFNVPAEFKLDLTHEWAVESKGSIVIWEPYKLMDNVFYILETEKIFYFINFK